MIPFGKWIVSTPTFPFSLQRVCRLSASLPTDSNSWSPADGTSAERRPGLALNQAKDHSLHEAQDRSVFLGGVHSLNGRLTSRQKSVMAFNWKSITGFVSYRTCQGALSRKSHSAKLCCMFITSVTTLVSCTFCARFHLFTFTHLLLYNCQI